MRRLKISHKGENGKTAVIGGSPTMHGAPILSALAAEASGADLVFLALPALHQDVARMASLNFQVHPFHSDDVSETDIQSLLELLATVDCAVIGPGMSRSAHAQEILRELIESAQCPLVLDASALQSWTVEAVQNKTAVCTPHLGELERMGIPPKMIGKIAKKHGIVIHAKGSVDRIAGTDGKVREVKGGNAGLTVGGTGDALAGLICGLVAQGMKPVEACVQASTVIKRAGTMLFQEFGNAYGARRVIGEIPRLLARMTNNQ